MNRVRKSSDRISKLSKQAVEETGKPDARVILQGRNENEGGFIPFQGNYLFGKKITSINNSLTEAKKSKNIVELLSFIDISLCRNIAIMYTNMSIVSYRAF